ERSRERGGERDVSAVIGGAGSTSGSDVGSPVFVPGEQQGQGGGGAGAQAQPIDGREFFKKARGRLSYDEFTTLLWNVKAYNAREQSRHRTLDNLSDLLNDRHRDLYDQFERLLMR
ncbi:hypothetical protein HK097_000938, partial [Rhizophlyctis rosea]